MRKIVLVLISLILISCGKDKVKIKISDFSKKQEVTLTPYKLKPYAMLKIHIKGQINDTIKINYNLYGNTDFFLTGEVDTLLVQTDYYGEGPVTLLFDPYRATEGEILIDFNL
ncbi:hypothetical protein [Salegentibacter maritimus]|uniref:hypothetical protein n=1 Tax=Salegentibacter maritimus TaxID=2794347 RepID=UPI0018E4443C|nr:hypothetical protein [Salegentibacter maritimus]MBI6117642.1 hypothetical protein [Salegentibacter maritimus]